MAVWCLLGIPAVGKHTVAKAISKTTGATVVDNMLMNLPVYTVPGYDGDESFPFPRGVLAHVLEIRRQVLAVIEQYCPRDRSFVFTAMLDAADPEDEGHFEEIAELSRVRDHGFYPMWLTADADASRERISSPERKARLKVSDPPAVDHYVRGFEMLRVTHPNALELDTTESSATSA